MKKLVYILEDSKLVCELTKYTLESSYICEVVKFNKPQDLLLEMLRQPDLIILDYFLEDGYSGLDVLTKLRKINKTVPVIFFSGQKDEEVRKHILQQGVQGYVDKSQENFLDELTKSIGSVLSIPTKFDLLNSYKGGISNASKGIAGLIGLSIFLSILLLII